MKEVIYPPLRRKGDALNYSVFLAGTIEMGNSPNWQQAFINRFNDEDAISFYNPRRSSGFSGEQSLQNDDFVSQVNWEIENIDSADIVIMYITAESKSPISLLEFGYCLGNDDIEHFIVACEPGFWRRGNIEVMCNRFGIPLFDDLDDVESVLLSKIEYLKQNE
jgi:hypothetical protein